MTYGEHVPISCGCGAELRQIPGCNARTAGLLRAWFWKKHAKCPELIRQKRQKKPAVRRP